MGIFESLAVILCVCAGLGWLAKIFRLPPLIGYIVAGALVSTFAGIQLTLGNRVVEVLGQLGVTLLLFLAGMELPVDNLLRVGRVALLTGIGQIAIVASLGYMLALGLGFGSTDAFYVGLALSFGSTIIVVKLFSEKRELASLHGKIATGFLLVQDFVAVGLLSVVTTTSLGQVDGASLGILIVKVAVLFSLAIFLSIRVMPILARHLAGSVELLFVSSIGWCLLVAVFVASSYVGLSLEIGGFLAGLALASSVEQGQIIARVKPLRDFFLTWFFVALGARLTFSGLVDGALVGLSMALFVVLVNPVVVMLLLSMQGYKRRTAFLTALPLSSVSEFSLILLVAAVGAGVVSPSVLPIVTLVTIITMAVSSYLIWHDKKIYWKLFGNSGSDGKDLEHKNLSGHVVLFGHNRIGSVIRPELEKLGFRVVVVDFDPEIVSKLKGLGNVVYGDLADHELYEQLDLDRASMVISTVPDVHDNLQFLQELKKMSKKPMVVSVASDNTEAGVLYKAGADYVLIPHAVGGEYLASLLNGEKDKDFGQLIGAMGKKHKASLV